MQEVELAGPIPIKYETNCLAYLTADKAFLDRLTITEDIWAEVAAAVRAQDEAALRLLETREEGRWKNYIDRWKELDAMDDPSIEDFEDIEVYSSAQDARRATFTELWVEASDVAQFIADYIEVYASSGHDIEGFDVNLVFKVAAHEHQTDCPLLGIPGLREPLEIIAD